GLEEYRTVREYTDMRGFALSPTFVFIDGRTGARLYSEAYHEEALYPAGQNTPALSSYFELMDKVLPSFLNTLSTQKIRGTRVLLKYGDAAGGAGCTPSPCLAGRRYV